MVELLDLHRLQPSQLESLTINWINHGIIQHNVHLHNLRHLLLLAVEVHVAAGVVHHDVNVAALAVAVNPEIKPGPLGAGGMGPF